MDFLYRQVMCVPASQELLLLNLLLFQLSSASYLELLKDVATLVRNIFLKIDLFCYISD